MKEDICFCDLAALNALDIADEAERQSMEDYRLEFPELEAELMAFEEAVGAIPYTAPFVPMSSNLKERLFQRINREEPVSSTQAAVSQSAIPESLSQKITASSSSIFNVAGLMLKQLFSKNRVTVRADELVWDRFRVPGVTVAPLHIDLMKREVVAVLQAAPGVRYPNHRHAAVEEIYMLEGDLMIDGQVYGAGDYIRSKSGSSHSPYTTGGCRFFVRTSIDDEYPG